MSKQVTISTQIPPDIKEWIIEDADLNDMSMSEWLNVAIQSLIEERTENLAFEDVDNMSLDELAELIDEYDLDIDPEDHTNFWGNVSHEKLRDVICDELDIEEEPEEELEE